MGPKVQQCPCGQVAKYRCSSCPVRYCSVACYKLHKGVGKDAPAPSLDSNPPPASAPTDSASDDRPPAEEGKEEGEAKEDGRGNEVSLKRLTELKWPPEPDESIFSDPLKREDPKPLRHSELERIATSPDLRTLLANPTLRAVLSALDSFQSPKSRHAALARLLGVDSQSLARPAASALMDRNSPPPLHSLLSSLDPDSSVGDAGGIGEAGMGGMGGGTGGGRDDWGASGWWLGYNEKRVWVGPEERRLMRLWADAVTDAIGGWGMKDGQLGWEL